MSPENVEVPLENARGDVWRAGIPQAGETSVGLTGRRYQWIATDRQSVGNRFKKTRRRRDPDASEINDSRFD